MSNFYILRRERYNYKVRFNSQNNNIPSSPSTGTATLNCVAGCNVHSLFKIPIENLDDHPSSYLTDGSQRVKLLQNCKMRHPWPIVSLL